jgi:hypothetical protein
MARIENGIVYQPYTGKVYQAEFGNRRSNWFETVQEAIDDLGYYSDWDTIYIKEYEEGSVRHGSLRSVNNKDQSLWEIE